MARALGVRPRRWMGAIVAFAVMLSTLALVPQLVSAASGGVAPGGRGSAGRPVIGQPTNEPPNAPADQPEFNLMDANERRQQREADAARSSAPLHPKPQPSGAADGPTATLPVKQSFKAMDRASAGGSLPPDPTVAAGQTTLIAVSNVLVRTFNKGTPPAQLTSQPLDTFLGATSSEFFFDPRVLYDTSWKRFVVVGTRKAASGTDNNRHIRLAVSTGPNAHGSYFRYKVNFSGAAGEWCDFPQLGMDQDALIITCNNFQVGSGTPRHLWFSIPKARAYNGLGFNFNSFQRTPLSTQRSIAPPLLASNVDGGSFPQESRDRAILADVDASTDKVTLYRMQNTAAMGQTTTVLQTPISVPAWETPPNAVQPGTTRKLETIGGRFQQHGVQTGFSLWLAHTEKFSSSAVFAVVRWYQFNYMSNTLTRTGRIWTTAKSDDWNPSVGVANNGNDVFFTFSSVDGQATTTSARYFPQMRTASCTVVTPSATCSGNNGPGSFVIGSASFSTDEFPTGRFRWGDYSQVSIDPTQRASGCVAGKRAWATNQYVDNASDHTWDQRVAEVGFC